MTMAGTKCNGVGVVQLQGTIAHLDREPERARYVRRNPVPVSPEV